MSNLARKETFSALSFVQEQNRLNKDIGGDTLDDFKDLCKRIRKAFRDKSDREEKQDKLDIIAQREKGAIKGREEEVKLFKADIQECLKAWDVNCSYPDYYNNLVDAIFHEEWGFASVAQWIEGYSEELEESTSCKVVGEDVSFLINGHQELQTFKLSMERRTRLVNALLTGEERENTRYKTEGKAEVYLVDGTRITMTGPPIAQEGYESIVFRKYTVKDYTFEEQEKRHTIPKGSGELFEALVGCGYNIAFTGALRTTKTTQLVTWQSYEDKTLEGVAVQTDPEIWFKEVNPGAPIMSYIADNEVLKGLIKPIMRSDADYIIMAEARDGVALYIAVKAANKGTRRVKMTYHTTDVLDFCEDVADDIVNDMGGNRESYKRKVAKSFHLVPQYIQLSDKSKKRLKCYYAMSYDRRTREVVMKPLCLYDYDTDDWTWQDGLMEIHEEIGMEESPDDYKRAKKLLQKFATEKPMDKEKGQEVRL